MQQQSMDSLYQQQMEGLGNLMAIKNLAGKLAKIISEIDGSVPKSGWNPIQKYAYVMESDLLDVVRKKLSEANIMVFSSVEEQEMREIKLSSGKMQLITNIKVKNTFVDADSGEQFSVYSMGSGADNLDKGVFKAITGAYKYFLFKNFLLSGEDDPEKDNSNQGGKGPANFAPKTPSKPKGPMKPQQSSYTNPKFGN